MIQNSRISVFLTWGLYGEPLQRWRFFHWRWPNSAGVSVVMQHNTFIKQLSKTLLCKHSALNTYNQSHSYFVAETFAASCSPFGYFHVVRPERPIHWTIWTQQAKLCGTPGQGGCCARLHAHNQSKAEENRQEMLPCRYCVCMCVCEELCVMICHAGCMFTVKHRWYVRDKTVLSFSVSVSVLRRGGFWWERLQPFRESCYGNRREAEEEKERHLQRGRERGESGG